MQRAQSSSEHFLHKFFHPESVVIVGATGNQQRISYNLLGNMVKLGYRGRIYPVNPKEKEILGVKTYPSVSDIAEVADLAVIGVSQSQTPAVLRECIAKGIKRIVLVAGGFSEIGEEGRRNQQEMLELVRREGVRAIGPNALSPVNSRLNFAVSFHAMNEIRPGGLSLIFQSGLYEPRIRALLSEHNLHLSKLIDLGNKMDVNEVDALSYLVLDPETRVIGLHMESIAGDPQEFAALLKKARALGKRVIVLKSGRTSEGAKAAASHTGAMVRGSDIIFDSVLKQCRAYRAATIEEFFDMSRAMERLGPLTMKGNRVVVAASSGGEGVVTTDLVLQQGLQMAKVSDASLEKLKIIFPPWEIGANPYDLGISIQFKGAPKVYETLVPILSQDENVDALHVQIPERLLNLPREFFAALQSAPALKKPLVVWTFNMTPGDHETLRWLEDQQIPVFSQPEKAVRALSVLSWLSRGEA